MRLLRSWIVLQPLRLSIATFAIVFVTVTGGLFGSALRAAARQDQAPQSVWDGIYSADQAKRGETVYMDLCANCHGNDLTGGDNSPALVGDSFLAKWNGKSVGDLFDEVQSMPFDNPRSLMPPKYADVLAYILSVNEFPGGDQELGVDLGTLKQIKFQSTKP